MKIFLLSLLAVALIIPSTCVLGVDVSQLFPTSTYQCIKNSGYSFVIIRGWCSFGGIDTNAVSNLNNAKAAGLITDIYLFPCRGKSASTQVDQLMAGISANLYGMIWVDVETNPSSGCGWTSDYNGNCAFLTEIINRIKSKGKVPGIYASRYMWQTIFGSFTGCGAVASQQLWYAHYDNSPSFSDFQTFGGWSRPHIKQFQGDTTLCGAGVDKNYYP
ncbi:unnamed protein product [Sphagnum balticum]